MKFLFVIIVLITGYLYYSYTHFYQVIGDHNLQPPTNQNTFVLENNKNIKSNEASFTYIALGDSLTAGVGSSDYKQTYPYLLANDYTFFYNRVTLVNLGVPAAKSEDVLNYQLPLVENKYPDLITLLIGINDVHDRVNPSQFEKNYLQIIDNLQSQTKTRIVLINIPYLGSSQAVYPPFGLLLNWRTNQLNSIIKKIATEKNLEMIDLNSAVFTKFKYEPNLYSKDSFHPSDAGYQIWSDIIYNALQT